MKIRWLICLRRGTIALLTLMAFWVALIRTAAERPLQSAPSVIGPHLTIPPSPDTCEVRSIAFSPDAKMLVGGGSDSTVRLLEARTGRLLRTFKGHKSQVEIAAFSPNGALIASGSDDGTVR